MLQLSKLIRYFADYRECLHAEILIKPVEIWSSGRMLIPFENDSEKKGAVGKEMEVSFDFGIDIASVLDT